jgi:hypothetical protein
VLGSNENPDPAAFDDKQWLASVYTTDGRTIYGLAHVEYQGNAHPGRCPSAEYFRCWWNVLALVVSTDGGRSYRRQGPRNGLVASVPYRYEPDLGVEGHRNPSQIVRNPADGYYYAVTGQDVLARPGVQREGGTCLIRTRNLADPTSWRTTDESGAFTRSFIDPYTQSVGPPRSHLCGTYLETRPGGSLLNPGLSWNTHLQRWLLVGSDQVDPRTDPSRTKWGVYFSVSKDLVIVTWTTQKLLLERNMAFVYTCGEPDPIMYPAIVDHASTSRSFETTGARAYLYYSVFHYRGCQQTLDRDLVRVPITISK